MEQEMKTEMMIHTPGTKCSISTNALSNKSKGLKSSLKNKKKKRR